MFLQKQIMLPIKFWLYIYLLLDSGKKSIQFNFGYFKQETKFEYLNSGFSF